MKIKKITSLILVAAMMCFTFASCGSGSSSSGGDDVLAAVLEKGELQVAVEAGDEPWAYQPEGESEYTGMAVEIIQGFGEAIGVNVVINPFEFSEQIPAVQSGKVDMIACNISRTQERSATVLFTEPVSYNNGVAVVRKESGFKSVTELDSGDITLTTPAGSIQEELAKEKFPKAKLSALGSTSDAMAALKAGRADAYITDNIQGAKMLESDSSLEMLPEALNSDTVAFALNLDTSSYTLRDAFNNYLKVIKIDGTYNELYKKYFGTDWVPLTIEYGA
ncbi:MAG: ABC transporter substrate-binding protein [Mogibacterium sp.]|nr:ABC transporter substrate-binding protein [Mogibacterium sp.]